MSGSRYLRQTTDRDRDKFDPMKTKKLTEVLERIEAWPPEVQDELADFALELDAGFSSAEYEPRNSPASFAVCAMPPKAASRRRSRSKPLSQNS
jgi:hypothetical protein